MASGTRSCQPAAAIVSVSFLGVNAFLDLQADKLEDAGEVDVVFDVIDLTARHLPSLGADRALMRPFKRCLRADWKKRRDTIPPTFPASSDPPPPSHPEVNPSEAETSERSVETSCLDRKRP